MEITSDQKRTICAMLAEQAGHPVRSAEITTLCNDETIRAALLVLSSLIDVKYREVSAALAAARAEHERNNPQMMMGSALADRTPDIPVSLPDTAHTVFPPAAEPEPLIVPPAPEEPVITDNTTAAVQSASAEEQAFAEIDHLSTIFGQHAFLPDAPSVPEPAVIHPGDPEPDFTFVFNEPAVAEPLNSSADNDDTEFTFVYNEPAAPTAADNAVLTASVFSDKSLFPEPAALSDPLKGGNWLFDDLDTDDTDTPVIGELPESAQPPSATASGNTIITGPQTPETSAGSTSDTLCDNSWSFSADTPPAPLQAESAEQKPRGLTALFAAGKENIPPQTAPDSVPQSAGETAVTPAPSPDSKAQATMTQPSGQPAIRVKIGRARLSESFSSPVTATLDDGRAVTILGIYFQRNIGLSFNDRTGILHGIPTEYGEFPVRVVWELAPKKRFSSDIHFAVDPGSHSTTPAPAGFPPQQ
ncbi:hypothetical protein ACMGC7_16845 [Morganella morganii]|uniref:hypothetical protein n=1 Tax=Morganella morganii TaxID=582 RepID=UPI003EB856AA